MGAPVTCVCGRHFETATLSQERLGGVYRAQLRMRLYTTLGTVVVAATAVIATVLFGLKGLALGLPLAGVIWFRIVGPFFRSRVFRGTGELPTWRLKPDKTPAEE